VDPLWQALFGGARLSSSGASRNEFAFTVGGGLDANVSKHFAIRLIQAEYLYTNFTAKGTVGTTPFNIGHQNNARLTFGIVIH
jgi:opacity protein-like surface antigen